MATTGSNKAEIDQIKIWINSVITESALPSELAAQTEITDITEVSVIQKGTDDAKGVATALLRGYNGTWNAATNTPTLIDGTGIDLDNYYVSADGTQDFGNGEVHFVVGDMVKYANGLWSIEGGASAFELNLLGNSSTTSVYNGGFLSVNADPTLFDISDGVGAVINKYSDPSNPTITEVEWSGLTGTTPTNIASFNLSFIAIDDTGAVVQQAADFTIEQRKDLIVLGNLVHIDRVNITATSDRTHDPTAGYLSADTAMALGDINILGNNLTPASTDLSVRKEAGQSFIPNGNRENNPKDPNFLTSGVLNPMTFVYIYNDGSGSVTAVPGQTLIDPDQYDDGDGVLGSVPNNKWTNQYFYFIPLSGLVLVRYGETVFDNRTAAENAVFDSPTVIGIGLDNDLIRTVLTLQKGTSDLTNATDVTLTDTGKFGLTGTGGAGGGGGIVQDMQDTYNNSVTPEITTDGTRGAVTYKEGQGDNNQNVIEVWNGAEATTFSVDGNGDVTSNNLVDKDTTQTVTGAKTFENLKMILRNVADTFSGFFTNTNTADRTYTLQDKSGTIAHLDDIGGVIETFTSSTSWVFNHGLNNQYPDIKCIDSLGFAFIPLNIEYVSTTQAVITHTNATAGKATADGGVGAAAPLSGTVYAGITSESVGIFYADNYATLQLAVDAIPSRGGTLKLSNKEYPITSSLIVDKPIIIEGGFNGTVISTSSATIDMIEFAHSDIVMRDIKLINTHVLPTAGTGIKITSGVVGGDPLLDLIGFRLDNMWISGFYDNVHVVNSFDWSINLCQIFAAVRYNVYIENQHTNDAGDANITNSWITNAGRAVVAGIKQISGGGLKLNNVKFNSGGGNNMLHCYDGTLPTSVIVMFSNCSFENFTTGGIRLTNTNNLSITGCQFASYAGSTLAIDVDNVNQTVIVGNQFRLDGNSDGISVINSNNVTLLNTFSNPGSGFNFFESGNTNVLNLNP